MTKDIHLIATVRTHFIKITPIYHQLRQTSWAVPCLVHAGQHSDWHLSETFFKDFQLPEPAIHLNVNAESYAQQTGQVMIEYEKVLLEKKPDLVIVVGSVNSTMAATLAATKLGIKVAHLEAGLRSFDRTISEEINRVVTDSIADLLLTPSADADENLHREGIPSEKICRVGNIVIDSLEMLRDKIMEQKILEELNLQAGNFGFITLHRASNVEQPEHLGMICEHLQKISQHFPFVFPIHPHTYNNLVQQGLLKLLQSSPKLRLVKPLSYVRFMNLLFHSRLVVTDSGALQEEATYLSIPCLTLAPNTERPITITQGTNRLCRLDQLDDKVTALIAPSAQTHAHTDLPAQINTTSTSAQTHAHTDLPAQINTTSTSAQTHAHTDLPAQIQAHHIELWDGHTAERVVHSIQKFLHIN